MGFAMDAVGAVVFSLYMIPLNLLDNVLRPLVMAKGLGTPIWIILLGVLGGTIVHGMLGLFVGPVVLSIAWQLIVLWTRNELIASNSASPSATGQS
jgi:predicted PurR-regulated permease PerM